MQFTPQETFKKLYHVYVVFFISCNKIYFNIFLRLFMKMFGIETFAQQNNLKNRDGSFLMRSKCVSC